MEAMTWGQVREKGRTEVAGAGFDSRTLSLQCEPSYKG